MKDANLTDPLPHEQRRARRPLGAEKLRRSKDHRLVGGILGGIAEFVGSSPLTVRALYGLTVLFTGGLMLISYPLLWLLLPGPERPSADEPREGKGVNAVGASHKNTTDI